MECPHCNYKHGGCWNEKDQYEDIDGEHGAFFVLSNGIVAVRNDVEVKKVYGCPACNKLFVDN